MSDFILLLATGLGVGGLYFLIASGLSLIFGLMRILSFAHGAIVSASAIVALEVVTAFDTSSTGALLLAIVCAATAGGLLALLMELVVIRPLYGREFEQLLATVGVGIALVALLQGIFGPDERLLRLPSWATSVTHIGGASIPNNRIMLFVAAALVLVAIQLFLTKTRFGLIIRAGVENPEMVRSLGIDVRRAFTFVFVIGGVAAGLAGALAAVYYRSASPTMGDHLLIFSFIVLVMGGLGSVPGAAIAAVVIGLAQSMTNFYVSNGIGDVLAVALLAAVLLVRPQGFLGQKEVLA